MKRNYSLTKDEEEKKEDKPEEKKPKKDIWDGLNDNGAYVASGVYICKVNSKNIIKTKKMTLIK